MAGIRKCFLGFKDAGFAESALFCRGGIFAESNARRPAKSLHTVISSGSEKSFQ
jgi:hypothetical protein